MLSIRLPAPIEMTMPLSQVLGRRRSRREFSTAPVDLPILSSVLWAGCGRTSADERRTAPSALNCREVECYVFDQKGVWRYDPEANTLEAVREGDRRADTTVNQAFVAQAPVTILVAADLHKGKVLVGSRTGDICRSVDAGAVVQNMLLACAAMGLAAVPRAQINVEAVLQAVGKSAEELEPQMAVTMGFPE